jgi:flagellar biogenesis protein FliO
MFDLFGAEMPLAVRFFLAFLIVLGLIGAAAWAVRRFGSTRFTGAVRGRQPRLAVIEYATVDTRRRLLLVRRDNVEHLMMIGGPTDVVVEANIVRAAPAALREPAMSRMGATAENLARAIPLPEASTNGSWPLQPDAPALPVQPPAQPRRAPRIEPLSEEPINVAPPHAEPIPRPQREALTALADDLAAVVPPIAPVTPLPPRNRPPPPARAQPAETRAEAREPRSEPPRAPAAAPIDSGSADQSLAEMAQRLEAALRKPKAPEPRPTPAAGEDESEPAEQQAAPPPPPRATRPSDPKPVRAEAKPKEGKAFYDSLEQEMASLLGRPANKT